MTIKEAAQSIGICTATIRRLMENNEIPYIRISPRRIIIPDDLLARWLEEKALANVRK